MAQIPGKMKAKVFLPLAVLMLLVLAFTTSPYFRMDMAYSGLPFIHHTCPTLSFSSTKLPITALASFPGSGNTWTRHLLQKMTGIATGAVYNDTFLRTHGFIGEGRRDGSVLVVKTHLPNIPQFHFERAILIVRNPYESFLAEFRRRYSPGKNQTGHTNIYVFMKEWDDYLNKKNVVHSYRSFYISWLQHRVLLPVFYDNLRRDLSRELTRIQSFLNVSGSIQCAVEDSEGIVHRKHSQDMPKTFFYSKEDIQRINRVIIDVKEKFKSRFPNTTFHMDDWLL